MKRKFRTKLAAFAGMLLLFPVTASLYYAGRLPDSYYVPRDGSLALSTALPVTAQYTAPIAETVSAGSSTQEAMLRLFGIFPIKTVSVQPTGEVMLVPGGQPFGVRMLMDGVMVIGFGEVAGSHRCPAAEAGIREGDILREADHETLTCTADLRDAAADGGPLLLTVQRGDMTFDMTLEPAFSVTDGCYQTGIWVRDSTAGIGTLTYYEPDSGCFGGLGHPICDPDTGEVIPLASGEADAVTISGAVPGAPGTPGSLQGYFSAKGPLGTLSSNSSCGIFGQLTDPPVSHAVPLGLKQEILPGKATILTTIAGEIPQAYDVEILSIDLTSDTQNLVIKVTDEALLAATGGIVQGMSGSPILQNGKLVGAVTHVFVGEPEKGYGIFAESMYAVTRSMK